MPSPYPYLHSTQEMQREKRIICHSCWIKFYIKSLPGRTKSRNCRLSQTAYRTSKSAQVLILFNWVNSMVVSSLPTVHMDDPMAGTATDSCKWTLSAKSVVAHTCSKGYCHISRCVLVSPPTTPIAPTEKYWKNKTAKNKNNLLLSLERWSLHFSFLQRQTILPRISHETRH